MKAIACLLIFVHHFYMHNSGVVQILGIWMVSVFFFFSAYGLCFSLEKNIGFAEYLKKRISKVWIPYLLVNLLTIICCHGRIPVFNTDNQIAEFIEAPTIIHYIKYITGISMIDSIMWFLNVLLLFYVLIFFMKYFKSPSWKIIYIFAVTLIYIAVAFTFKTGFYTYTGILGFPLGVLAFYIKYKTETLNSVFFKIVGSLSIALLIGSIVFCVYKQSNNVRLLADYGSNYLLIICSCFLLYWFRNSFLGKDNKVVSFLGVISYELYLVHMKVIVFFNTALPETIETIWYNPILLMFISIVIATAVHALLNQIYKLIK